MTRTGIAADHGGFVLKGEIMEALRRVDYDIQDLDAFELNPKGGYPDFMIPLAQAAGAGQIECRVTLCVRGMGAPIAAAAKIPGVRAALVQDRLSACQDVKDNDTNVLCLSGKARYGR